MLVGLQALSAGSQKIIWERINLPDGLRACNHVAEEQYINKKMIIRQ